MKSRMRFEARDWRRGVIIFLALCLLGVVGGALANKAEGVAPDRFNIPCDSGDGCSATVARPREGVRKFRNHRLGHAGRLYYNRHNRRVILDELMALQHRRNSRSMGTHMSRTQMWRNFTSHDNCVWAWKPYGGSGSGQRRTYSCEYPNPGWTTAKHVSHGEVVPMICAGVAGIGLGGAIAAGATTGPAAPWTYAGIGTAFVLCMWMDNIERATS